jgi:F-type H+-transporting ATPase subunit c
MQSVSKVDVKTGWFKKSAYALGAVGAYVAASSAAFAQEGGAAMAEATSEGGMSVRSWALIAGAVLMAAAAISGTTAQGKAASTAFEGIARNPGSADKMFTPLILGLALIESLVVLSFVISFLIQGKVPAL